MSLTTPTEEPVLDLEPFHELFDDGDPEGATWLASYLESAVRAFEEMRDALATRDRTKLAVSAHRIGGTSLTVGARRVGILCQMVEIEAPRMPLTELGALVADADKQLDAVRDAIARFVAPS